VAPSLPCDPRSFEHNPVVVMEWLQCYLRRSTERRGRGVVSLECEANPQAKWSSVSETVSQIPHIYRLYSESLEKPQNVNLFLFMVAVPFIV
jgi:hypothetical protein